MYFGDLADFIKEETEILKQPLFGDITDDSKSARNETKTLVTKLEETKGCLYCKKKQSQL